MNIFQREFFHVPVYAWAVGGVALVVGIVFFMRQRGKGQAMPITAGLPGTQPPYPYPTGNSAIPPQTMPPIGGGGQPPPSPPLPIFTPGSVATPAMSAASTGQGPPVAISTPFSSIKQWLVSPTLGPGQGPLPLISQTGAAFMPQQTPIQTPSNAMLSQLQPTNPAFISNPILQPRQQPVAQVTTAPGGAYLPRIGGS